jgi:hypothetical protein
MRRREIWILLQGALQLDVGEIQIAALQISGS